MTFVRLSLQKCGGFVFKFCFTSLVNYFSAGVMRVKMIIDYGIYLKWS